MFLFTQKIQGNVLVEVCQTLMQRRVLLTTVGTGILTGVAGCLGSDDEDGPPDSVDTGWPFVDSPLKDTFKVAYAAAPGTVTIREPFSIEVHVGNATEEEAEFEGRAGFVPQEERTTSLEDESRSSKSIEATSIASGDVAVFTIDGLQASSVGQYELLVENENGRDIGQIEEYESPQLTVEARTGTAGDSIEISDRLRAAPTDVQFVNELQYDASRDYSEETDIRVRETLDDRVLAVCTVRIENMGTEQLTIRTELFRSLGGGETLTEFPEGELSDATDIEIPPLIEATVDPGSALTGWIGFVYDREAIQGNTIRIGAFLDDWTPEQPEVIWELTG